MAFYRSITAKLFYLLLFIVAISISANSYRSAAELKEVINSQVEANLEYQAEKAMKGIEGLMSSWMEQWSIILPYLSISDPEKMKRELDIYLSRYDSLVSVSIYTQTKDQYEFSNPELLASAQTKKYSDARFGDIDPLTIANSLFDTFDKRFRSELNKNAKNSSTLLSTASLDKKAKFIQFASRYRAGTSASEEKYFWISLSFWQESFYQFLPYKTGNIAMIVDKNGQVFAATDTKFHQIDGKTNKELLTHPLIKMAVKNTSNVGFAPSFSDSSNKRWLGAFAKSTKFVEFSVLVQRDFAIAYQMLNRSLIKAALYGGFFFLIAILLSYLGSSGLTRSIRDLTEATKKIAAGDFSTQVSPKSHDEIGILSLSINDMVVKINQLLFMEVENSRKEQELETARIVQSTLFPKSFFKSEDIIVDGYYHPATECGGDLWGYIKQGDDRILVYVADAMGHGVPAALVTAIAYSIQKTIEDILNQYENMGASPSAILDRINRIIYNTLGGKIHMTCFVAAFDLKNQTFSFANAGHNSPLYFHSSATLSHVENLAKAPLKIKSLSGGGVPLGIELKAEYKERQVSIKAGDRIVLYTDGLIENKNQKGLQLGNRKLQNLCKKYADQSLFDFKKCFINEAFAHYGGSPLGDDVTIVVIDCLKNFDGITNQEKNVTALKQYPEESISKLELDLDSMNEITISNKVGA